ncbi:lytic transglycosylase domain-containing protein [Robertmurraya massiliosenegalensis]|uniref:lytic transglycosylase domain-containing protein n=1 Tax=Robertmurraya TaxID=2837507 RepID=UPI0039A43C04
MYKYLLLLIIPLFFCFGTPSEASNFDYYTKRLVGLDQKAALQEEIIAARQNVESLPEGTEKEQAISSLISLEMKKTKVAAFVDAYSKALGKNSEGHAAAHTSFSSKITPGQIVPAAYIPIYKSAGERYGVEWPLLAAIHKVETDFSRIKKMISYAGAIGHMQFMPQTFKAYGVDGNGNSIISPWELEDAIFSAAHYLKVSGIDKNVRTALWHYNHSQSYIDQVLDIAATIKGVSQ